MENAIIVGRIQMQLFIPVEIFRKKTVIPFEVLPFSRFYRNGRDFVPFVWLTSARLALEAEGDLF